MAANHNGQIGNPTGGASGFGAENGFQIRTSRHTPTRHTSERIGIVPIATSTPTSG
jgi:hypothetical protein